MKMSIRLIIIILVFTVVESRSDELKGNLLHINFTDMDIHPEDTLGEWQNINSDVYSYGSEYLKAITSASGKYFVKLSSEWYSFGQYENGGGLLTLENIATNLKEIYAEWGLYIRIVYIGEPSFYEIDQGVWLFDDIQGHGFLSDDSFYIFNSASQNPLIYITGKVDSLYLGVILDSMTYEYSYYTINLNESPQIDFKNAIKIEIDGEINPIIKHYQMPEYRILLSSWMDTRLMVYDLFEGNLRYFKTVYDDNKEWSEWFLKDGYIYRIIDNELWRYSYNEMDYIIDNDTMLCKGTFVVDIDSGYVLMLHNDSLSVYGLESMNFMKKWDISGVNNPTRPLFDFPDIYLHQQISVSALEQQEPVADHFALFQNYPNPFNAETMISYSLPPGSATVSIKIYNVAGQVVRVFNNPPQMAGVNKLKWDGRDDNGRALSSGIYFCALEVNGQFRASQKMIMMK